MTTRSDPKSEAALAGWESALASATTREKAQEALEAILELRRHDAPGLRADALHKLGHVRARGNDFQGAIEAWRNAADLLSPSSAPAERKSRGEILIDLGGLFCATGNGGDAEATLIEAIGLLRGEDGTHAQIAWAHNLRASALQRLGRDRDALAALYDAESASKVAAQSTRSAADAANWALILNNLGRAEHAAGDFSLARVTMEQCLVITKELTEARGSQYDLTLHAAATNRHGLTLERLDEPAEALRCHTEAAEVMRALVAGGRQDLADDLAGVEADLSRVQAAMAAR